MNQEDELYGLISTAKQQQKIIEDQQRNINQLIEEVPHTLNQAIDHVATRQETQQQQLITNTQQQWDDLSKTIRAKLWFSIALPFLLLCSLAALSTGLYINHLIISTPELREENRLLTAQNKKLKEHNAIHKANFDQLALYNTETYSCKHKGKAYLCARIMISWGPQAGQNDLYILDPKDD